MAKRPTPENVAAGLTVPERVLLFCLGSRTDWVKAGVKQATTRHLLVKSLVERDQAGHLVLTDEGRAVLSAMLGRAGE